MINHLLKWFAIHKLLKNHIKLVHNKEIKHVSIFFSTPVANYQSLNPLKIHIFRIDKEEYHMKIISDKNNYQIIL